MLNESCKLIGYFPLLFKCVQKPGVQDLKLAMRDLSKNVAQSVSELVKSCEALKGMISIILH